MKDAKVQQMTQLAILTAVTLLMAFTPLGYLRTAGLEISLITIPVAIGAMVLGPKAGAFLGAVFGLTSFYQCFGMSPFGAAMLSISFWRTFVFCVPTRILAGWLTGVIFEVISAKIDNRAVPCYIGGFLMALLNTIFFMSAVVLLFWNTEYLQQINQTLGGKNPLVFIILFVGVNGLCELPATCIAAGAVSYTLRRVFHIGTVLKEARS